MEKRRIRLDIHGVVIGLVTQESDEYMETLAREVEQAVEEIHTAAPSLTGEAVALTVALGYCDDLHKRPQLQEPEAVAGLAERVRELGAENARLAQAAKAGAEQEQRVQELTEQLQKLEAENARLAQAGKDGTEQEQQVRDLTGQLRHLESENARLEAENLRLVQEKSALAQEKEALQHAGSAPAPAAQEPPVEKHKGNPLRYEDQLDQMGLVSFFEQEQQDEQ